MKVFTLALDEGSLAGAGRVLRRSPAAVGRAIAYLENHVGTPLLYRTTRTMRLSEIGERYATICRRILNDLDEAEIFAAGERSSPQGILTISAPPAAGDTILWPIINSFLREYPTISVRVLMIDRFVNLIDEGIDLTLRVGKLLDSSLVAINVGGGVRRVTVAAPRYLANHPRITEPGDLAKHHIIAMASLGLDSWTFPPKAGSPTSRVVKFTPRIVVNSVPAAISSACDGLGVTRLYSYHLADKIREKALQIVLADAELPALPVHLIGQRARMSVPKVRAFVDFASPRLRAEFLKMAAEL